MCLSDKILFEQRKKNAQNIYDISFGNGLKFKIAYQSKFYSYTL